MSATKLRLEGESKWGSRVSMPLFLKNGLLSVKVLRCGSLKRVFIPYSEYASANLRYCYIIER